MEVKWLRLVNFLALFLTYRKAPLYLTSFTRRSKFLQEQELVDRHFLPGMGAPKENSCIPRFFHGSQEIRERLLVERKCVDTQECARCIWLDYALITAEQCQSTARKDCIDFALFYSAVARLVSLVVVERFINRWSSMSQVKSHLSFLGETLSCNVGFWLNRVESDEEVNHFVGKEERSLVWACVSNENEARASQHWRTFLMTFNRVWWFMMRRAGKPVTTAAICVQDFLHIIGGKW